MNDLAQVFAAEVVAILEAEIDRRVQLAFAELDHRNGDSPWLSEVDAAAYLGVSKRIVQRLVARDRVRSSTIGRRRLLHRDDLDRAATREEVAPTTPPRRRRG